jgi:hypothetical protein
VRSITARTELKAWTLVSKLAFNSEHWQTRLKLVEALTE